MGRFDRGHMTRESKSSSPIIDQDSESNTAGESRQDTLATGQAIDGSDAPDETGWSPSGTVSPCVDWEYRDETSYRQSGVTRDLSALSTTSNPDLSISPDSDACSDPSSELAVPSILQMREVPSKMRGGHSGRVQGAKEARARYICLLVGLQTERQRMI